MNTKQITGSALATLLTSAGIAVAQPPPQGPGRVSIDADKNGAITRVEAAAAADRMFAELDQDKDGFLTPADRPAPPEGGPEGKPGRGDVVVERREFRHGGPPGPGRPPRPHHPPIGMFMIASMDEADANGDGKVSKDEFRTLHLRYFDAADVNGDGQIKLPPAPPMPPAPPPR
jgi:hypothetical protein